jgi:hypothetical protein
MVFVPFCCNTLQWWIQDSFLKGDKHISQRIEQQMEVKRATWLSFLQR